MNVPALFRSLEHRNFRLFFMGQGVSLVGTWMQMTAVAWLVWRLGHNAWLLGLAGFAARIPTFVLAPFAGVLVDRADRRRLVLLTQALSMAQALMLAGLMYSGRLAIWHVIALSLLLGCINAFDVPARQSFLVQMLDRREDLTNAIALNSSMVNGARLIGPSIAGLLIAGAGEALCFLLNGLSYLAVIAGLLMMRIRPGARVGRQTAILENLREGFRYAFGFPPIRSLLLLLALVSLAGASYTQLLPIFASRSCAGTRAPRASSFRPPRSARSPRAVPGRPAQRARARAGDRLGARRLRRRPDRAGAVGAAVADAAGDGRDRARVDGPDGCHEYRAADDRRRRQARAVMSFYSMAFMGMVPLGSLLAGVLAQVVGAPLTMILGGAAASPARSVSPGAFPPCASSSARSTCGRDHPGSRRRPSAGRRPSAVAGMQAAGLIGRGQGAIVPPRERQAGGCGSAPAQGEHDAGTMALLSLKNVSLSYGGQPCSTAWNSTSSAGTGSACSGQRKRAKVPCCAYSRANRTRTRAR